LARHSLVARLLRRAGMGIATASGTKKLAPHGSNKRRCRMAGALRRNGIRKQRAGGKFWRQRRVNPAGTNRAWRRMTVFIER